MTTVLTRLFCHHCYNHWAHPDRGYCTYCCRCGREQHYPNCPERPAPAHGPYLREESRLPEPPPPDPHG